MGYFLAIDAGGTKAEYLLADGQRILARASSGTIKRMRTSAEIASGHLAGALAELEASSGVSLHQVTHTCVGTAGNTVPLVTDWLRSELGSRVGGELLVLGDVEIALDAAFPNESGVLILAGTGSNVAGRNRSGKIFGAGGYGPVLSDQGSGHRIGNEALRAAFLAKDEDRETTLLTAILEHWKLADVNALVAYANTCPASHLSTLSHVVAACAEAGDAISLEVLQGEGSALAHLGVLVYRKLCRAETPAPAPRFAFAGSILAHVRLLREAVIQHLAQHTENPTVIGLTDPIEGALWRARRGGA